MEKNWTFQLYVPMSTHKTINIIKKYDNFLFNTAIRKKRVIHIFNLPPNYLCEAMKDYYSIRNLKDADYLIIRDGIEYPKTNDGHHCYYIKYSDSDEYPYHCFYGYYGRLSIGCKKIPIYESLKDWNKSMSVNFVAARKEIFWYQAGFVKDDKWMIDKVFLKSIVNQNSQNLMCCPVFFPDKILELIGNLPDYIPLDSPDFNFNPLPVLTENQISDGPRPQYLVTRRTFKSSIAIPILS